MKNTFIRWAPAVLVMITIFVASSTPSKDLPSFGGWDTLVKKAGHMAGYGFLALGFLRALNRPAKQACLAALVLVFLYALSDEIHQSFVPGRHPSPQDVGIDLLGAAVGIWAWLASARLRNWILLGIKPSQSQK